MGRKKKGNGRKSLDQRTPCTSADTGQSFSGSMIESDKKRTYGLKRTFDDMDAENIGVFAESSSAIGDFVSVVENQSSKRSKPKRVESDESFAQFLAIRRLKKSKNMEYTEKYNSDKSSQKKESMKKIYALNRKKKIEDVKNRYAQNKDDRIKYGKNRYAQNKDDRVKYGKNRYAQNKDDRIKYGKNRYQRNKDVLNEYSMDRYTKDRETRIEYSKNRYQNFREDCLDYSKDRYQDSREDRIDYRKMRYKNNREDDIEYSKNRYQNNREDCIDYGKMRYKNNREDYIEYSKNRYLSNRHEQIEYSKNKYRLNKEKLKEYRMERYKTNNVSNRQSGKEKYLINPEKKRLMVRRYRLHSKHKRGLREKLRSSLNRAKSRQSGKNLRIKHRNRYLILRKKYQDRIAGISKLNKEAKTERLLNNDATKFKSSVVNRLTHDRLQKLSSPVGAWLNYRRSFSVRQSQRVRIRQQALTVVNKVLYSKKYLMKDLMTILERIREFNKDIKDVEAECKTMERKSFVLGENYLGDKNNRYHLKTCESSEFDTNSVTYWELSSLVSSCKANSRKSLARPCNSSCMLPNMWSIRLFTGLCLLDLPAESPLVDYQKALIKFESCSGCDHIDKSEVLPSFVQDNDPKSSSKSQNSYEKMDSDRFMRSSAPPILNLSDPPVSRPICPLGAGECSDMIALLRNVQVHSKKLRKLLRDVYTARRLNIELMKVDKSLLHGNFKALLKLKVYGDNDCDTVGQSVEADQFRYNETEMKATYADLIEKFQEREADHPLSICVSCEQFYPDSKGKIIEGSSKLSVSFVQQRNMIENDFDKDFSVPYFICNDCFTAMQHGDYHAKSIVNGFTMDDVPEELSCLNNYEKFLITLAQPFFTVIKLKPYTYKGPDGNLAEASKGNAIHLPIPVSDTLNHTVKSLPVSDAVKSLKIIVEGHPTKKHVVWRHLIDLNKVFKALTWLKDHNPQYENIVINELAETELALDNENIILVENNGTNEDETVNRYDDHLLTQTDKHPIEEHYSVMDVNAKQIKAGQDLEHYRQYKVTGESIPDDQKNLDLKCFPNLFPKGQYGKDMNRPRTVRGAEFYRYRLNHCSGNLRMEKTYLFDANFNKNSRQISQGAYHATKTGNIPPNTTARDWMNMVDKNETNLYNDLEAQLSGIRNTKEWWNRITGDLSVYDEQLGPCTFFVTLSCAENHWPELRKLLIARNPNIEGFERFTTSTMCAKDPVTFSEYYNRRWLAFKDEVLLNKDGPLGEVEHYFCRLEYQARGAPHIHMKLWIKDAPIYGEAPDHVVQQFIQRHISCELPDEDTELGQVIRKFNLHKCTKSCTRRIKKGYYNLERCRYGFPRPQTREFEFNKMSDVIESKSSSSKKIKKLYSLRRTSKELCVNDYNPVISLIWQSNTDVQYIGEKSRALNQYVTSYITKGEKNVTDGIWETLDNDKSTASRLRSLALMATKNREIGIFEVADNLLQHPLYYRSDGLIWVGTNLPGNRKRKPKSYEDMKYTEPNSKNIYCDNLIDVYYIKRPDCMKDYCLADVAANYRRESIQTFLAVKREETREKYYELKDFKGYFRKLDKPLLVKTPYIRKTPQNKERYFHDLLQLYKPYYDEDELLCGLNTYEEAFNSCVNDLPAMQLADYRKQQLENAKEFIRDLEAKAEEKAAADVEKARIDEVNATASLPEPEFLPPDAPANIATKSKYQPDFMTIDGVQNRVSSLNDDQLRIFNEVMETIDHSVKHQLKECSCSEFKPLKKFVSGVAGTGKSRLIEVLTEALTVKYRSDPETVIIGAPTGVAADNVGGKTLHSIFNLPVEHGKTPKYRELNKDAAKKFHRSIAGMKLLIIDEISMVSNLTLSFINQRLCDDASSEIDQCTTPFGGHNVLVFGDLLQLPPVSNDANPFFYETVSPQLVKQAYDCVGVSISPWTDASYDELTVNMRQKDDLAYAEMLNRLRLGIVDDEDSELLKSRIISSEVENADDIAKHVIQKFKDKKPLIIVPHCDSVKAINEAFLKAENLDVVTITAVDSNKRLVSNHNIQVKSKCQTKDLKTNDTAALETTLQVAVGARVMLRKNLCVAQGLYNGALGTVKAIKKDSKGQVVLINVKFDLIEEPVDIERFTADFEYSSQILMSRSQFPLTLAYSMTVHKCQGISIDNIICNIGDDVFCPAMSYVALSRVRSLNGLHLIAFNPDKIRCCEKVICEYNRLREEFTKLPPFTEYRAAKAGFFSKKTKQKIVTKEYIDQMSSQSIPPPKTTKKNNNNNVPPISDGPYFLKLRNGTKNGSENSCFVNSLVQCLLHVPGFVDSISNSVKTRNESAALHPLRLLVNNFTTNQSRLTNVSKLKSAVRPLQANATYNDNQQHDTCEFYERLFTSLPNGIINSFTFKEKAKHTCSGCGLESETLFDQHDFFYWSEKRLSDEPNTLEQSIVTESTVEKACSSCNVNLIDHSEVKGILMNGRYLVVSIPPMMTQYNEATQQMEQIRRDSSIIVNDSNNIIMFGQTFKLLSFNEHFGETIEAGHYKAWVKSGNNQRQHWLQISDTSLDNEVLDSAPDLKNAYLLFLERV